MVIVFCGVVQRQQPSPDVTVASSAADAEPWCSQRVQLTLDSE